MNNNEIIRKGQLDFCTFVLLSSGQTMDAGGNVTAEGLAEAVEEDPVETTQNRDYSIENGYSLENVCSSPEKVITSIKKPEKVYTVDDAIEKIGFGPFQVLITLFCGLLWVADAMELMLLSILSPIVKCQWSLTSFEEAMITSIVFFGVFLGGMFWGVMCDVIGRKRTLLIVDISVLVFGILSALKVSSDDGRLPGYPWLLICRFGVGFSAAGTAQVVTYYAEFLPMKGRGVCIVLIAAWWTIGTMFGALLAIGVLGVGHLNWHWYLGLAATPLGLVLFLFPLVPESARFYLVKGKYDKAKKVIERVAKMNFKSAPSGRLVLQEEKEKNLVTEDVVVYRKGTVCISDHLTPVTFYNISGNDDGTDVAENDAGEVKSQCLDDNEDLLIQDDGNGEESQLLIPGESSSDLDGVITKNKVSKLKALLRQLSLVFVDGMWKTTVILAFLWFGSSLLYYGVVLLTTSLLTSDPHCGVYDNVSKSSNASMFCEDNQLDTSDYIKIFWSAGAEFPGLLVTFVIIEIIGRKKTMAIEFFVCMIGFLLLFICASETVLTIFLFIIRAFTAGVFQAAYVYTPEVYPTKSRALGLGVCNTAARVGGIMTPILAQVLFNANDYATLTLYAGSCVVFAVLALLLPIETKGRALHDAGGS